MASVSLITWGIAVYAVVMVGVAWGFDLLARRTSKRSMQWRTSGFVYHESHDAWLCPEDQWLWPTSFDPDNRVMRYQGKADICNTCPVKATCTVSTHGKVLTREIDQWPHSESGRFHRGISVAVAVMGLIMACAGMLMARHALEYLVLSVAALIVLVVGAPLAVELMRTPMDTPDHIVHHTDKEAAVAATKDRFAQKWGGDSRGREDRWGGVSRERLIPITPVSDRAQVSPGSAARNEEQ